MSQTVLPYNDFFVRYLFSDENNVDLLLSFINAVHEDYELPLIKEITITNPFNLKKYKFETESIIDVKAVDNDGKQFDIEVQVSGNESFIYRSLYYWGKLYTSQKVSSSNYEILKPTICINLLNFSVINTDSAHTCFLLREMKNPEILLTDHLLLHFLELPKFKKQETFQTTF